MLDSVLICVCKECKNLLDYRYEQTQGKVNMRIELIIEPCVHCLHIAQQKDES
jgi:hypothetical protein